MKPQIKPISIFEAIRRNPKFEQSRSADWFREKIKELGQVQQFKSDQANLMKSTKDLQTFRLMMGTMTFFSYDPKYKETLPYYDKFPLSFIFGIDKTGFNGINFHYLSYPMRIKLFDKMWQIAKLSHLPTQQVLQLNWQLLSAAAKFPEVQPAVKRYLFNHVQSRFIKVPIEDWKTAIMLDNSQFKKQAAANVYKISARIAANALSR